MEKKNQDTENIKKVTVDGLELTVDTNNVDDMDFLELSDKVQDDITLYPRLLRKLIGNEQYDEVRDHYIKKNKRFSTANASEVFESIIKLADPKD